VWVTSLTKHPANSRNGCIGQRTRAESAGQPRKQARQLVLCSGTIIHPTPLQHRRLSLAMGGPCMRWLHGLKHNPINFPDWGAETTHLRCDLLAADRPNAPLHVGLRQTAVAKSCSMGPACMALLEGRLLCTLPFCCFYSKANWPSKQVCQWDVG
jgi:hypothetical protein